MQPILKCSRCQSDLIRDYGRKQKLRTNILIFENGKCFAKCLKCKADIEVPLTLDIPITPRVEKKKLKYVVTNLDKR